MLTELHFVAPVAHAVKNHMFLCSLCSVSTWTALSSTVKMATSRCLCRPPSLDMPWMCLNLCCCHPAQCCTAPRPPSCFAMPGRFLLVFCYSRALAFHYYHCYPPLSQGKRGLAMVSDINACPLVSKNKM